MALNGSCFQGCVDFNFRALGGAWRRLVRVQHLGPELRRVGRAGMEDTCFIKFHHVSCLVLSPSISRRLLRLLVPPEGHFVKAQLQSAPCARSLQARPKHDLHHGVFFFLRPCCPACAQCVGMDGSRVPKQFEHMRAPLRWTSVNSRRGPQLHPAETAKHDDCFAFGEPKSPNS